MTRNAMIFISGDESRRRQVNKSAVNSKSQNLKTSLVHQLTTLLV